MKKRVLIIDDDPVIRLLVSDYLTSLDYEPIAVESAIQALEKLTSIDPELLLVDMQMPIMDGIEFVRKIRTDEKYNNLPTILMSANSDVEKILAREEVCVDHILKKPFELSEVQEKLSSLV